MIEAVLFDVGDTFVHFETSNLKKFLVLAATPAWERLRELGMTPPPLPSYIRSLKLPAIYEVIWSRIRRREARLMPALLAKHRRLGMNLSEEQWSDVLSRCVPVVRQYFQVDEEAVSVMRALHANGIKLGIVSNTMFPAFAIDDVLEHDGLLEWFPVRIYSSDVGYMKPHPKIFEMALDQLGVRADRTIFIGDRMDNDVRGASRLGMTTVLITRNGKTPRGRPRPDHAITRLSQLLPLVES
jgi:HAD superfamily hydrolase (TIGR01662 family)